MITRFATPGDVPAIGGLIRELALYERAPAEAIAGDDDIRRALFCEAPHVFCHVVELEGDVVALALWFLTFSTWLGTSGLYLEDLFVKEQFRGRGIGSALMRTLARLCVERRYSRFQWSVLDWNTPSIDFYRSLGAEAMDEWTTFRLSGDALHIYGSND